MYVHGGVCIGISVASTYVRTNTSDDMGGADN